MKTILLILDGFGASPVNEGNAVNLAKTPNFDRLIQNFPHTLLMASGKEVGLPWGEPGNSEVGHLNVGSGRIIYQDLPRINLSIEDGSFFKNPALLEVINFVKKTNHNLHLIGLASDGGVHSHLNHLFALLKLVKNEQINKVYLHLILDGRDAPQKSAQIFLSKIEGFIKKEKIGEIATISGRYYAMDRDKHWERTQLAYEAITQAKGQKTDSASLGLKSAYKLGETDEFVKPQIINNPGILAEDGIIFFNFRADRAKQLTAALVSPNFKDFPRNYIDHTFFVSFTNYGFESTPRIKIAYFPQNIDNTLAQVIANNKLKQFHLAETEKYAHVTYFFNGGREDVYPGETRKMIPSPRVATYDLKPEMSVQAITRLLTQMISKQYFQFIITNLANPDMVGHTGNLKAAIKACEYVDSSVGQIIDSALKNNYAVILTADHGNAEQMINPQTQLPDPEHTTNPVPIILIDKEKTQTSQDTKEVFFANNPIGVLSDVTTSVLALLEINKPEQMTGEDVISHI